MERIQKGAGGTATASKSSTLPLAESTCGYRIIENDGKRFRVETLDGKEFRLPLNKYRHIDWQSMDTEQIIEYAKAYCKEHGILRISELVYGRKRHIGLSHVLKSRKLIDLIFPRQTEKIEILGGMTFSLSLDRNGGISWKRISNEQLIEYAKAYCREHGIIKMSELQFGEKKHTSLAIYIIKRGLSKKVFPRETVRIEILEGNTYVLPLNTAGNTHWKEMDDKLLVDYAKAFCRQNEYGASEFSWKRHGAHNELKRRRLLGIVFSNATPQLDLSVLAKALGEF